VEDNENMAIIQVHVNLYFMLCPAVLLLRRLKDIEIRWTDRPGSLISIQLASQAMGPEKEDVPMERMFSVRDSLQVS
jgi:hypothetical protein